MKAIGYLRVSKSLGMTVENQRPILEAWFRGQGVKPEEITWIEEAISTLKERPGQKQALASMLSGEAQLLAAVRLDRWGRSLQELITTVNKMIDAGGRVAFPNSGMDLRKDTYDASSRLMLNIFSSFAQYERDIIQDRTNEGLDRARAEGKRLGRRPGSKDKNGRRKSGYWLRWDKEKNPQKYGLGDKKPLANNEGDK